MAVNTAYEHLSREQLTVLENDTLDQLRKLSAVGESHSINGRSVSLPKRNELLQALADIRRALKSRCRIDQIQAQGGSYDGYHSTYAGFNQHF